MMGKVDDMFKEIFGSTRDLEVHQEILTVTGHRIVTRWSGVQKDLVVKRAQQHVEELCKSHIPSYSNPYQHKDGWAVDVTSYVVQV